MRHLQTRRARVDDAQRAEEGFSDIRIELGRHYQASTIVPA
jgi:hypothetical protein